MAQQDKDPSLLFLGKNGKPVHISLRMVLNEQAMKDRTYALGQKEVFADEDVKKKVKSLKYNGKPVIDILRDRYGI